jgi:hypothetical protein
MELTRVTDFLPGVLPSTVVALDPAAERECFAQAVAIVEDERRARQCAAGPTIAGPPLLEVLHGLRLAAWRKRAIPGDPSGRHDGPPDG